CPVRCARYYYRADYFRSLCNDLGIYGDAFHEYLPEVGSLHPEQEVKEQEQEEQKNEESPCLKNKKTSLNFLVDTC
ncbi:hypothetical protein VT99_12981, partial [Candidatus Electrothrix marina]